MALSLSKNVNGEKLVIALTGRLDTTTAPQLEAEIKNSADGMSELVLNFKALDYISSAGLRVLLAAQKRMAKQGKLVITDVSEDIMEVFDITGFTDILTIE